MRFVLCRENSQQPGAQATYIYFDTNTWERRLFQGLGPGEGGEGSGALEPLKFMTEDELVNQG